MVYHMTNLGCIEESIKQLNKARFSLRHLLQEFAELGGVLLPDVPSGQLPGSWVG